MFRTLFLFFASMPALAAESPSPGVSAGTYVQTGFALLLIVAALFGTVWLAKKLSGHRVFGQGGMKIIGSIALGPRERIMLIEIGDDWLVVGVIPGQIRTLHQLPKGTPMQEALRTDQDKPFSQWLKSVSERGRHE